MGVDGHIRLSESLRLAEVALQPRRARAFGNFDLDLPPATGGGETLSPAALQALGTLYLQAELEQAGVIPGVEALVEARSSLSLPTEQMAALLERFAQDERNWYDRASRQQLFARVFGVGPAATADAGAAVNRPFEQLLAGLCAAIYRYASDQSRFGPAPAGDEAAISQAANSLLGNLGLRQYGNTVFAARRIQEELLSALAVLKDAGIQALFNAKGVWTTLERILAPNAPDIARLVQRGQAGLHLLSWLAAAMPAIGGGAALPISPEVTQWAATWLAASGIGADAAPLRSVA